MSSTSNWGGEPERPQKPMSSASLLRMAAKADGKAITKPAVKKEKKGLRDMPMYECLHGIPFYSCMGCSQS